MKIRKTRTILLALFLFVTGATFAQSTPDQKAKALTDRQKTQLTLTDDQYKQVYDINLDFVNKLGSVKADSGGKMAKFKKLKEIDKTRDAAMQKVLTAEQFGKFQEVKQENREEMKEKYKERKNNQ